MPKVPKNLSTFSELEGMLYASLSAPDLSTPSLLPASTGLANRPVFFGCEDASTPLIVRRSLAQSYRLFVR